MLLTYCNRIFTLCGMEKVNHNQEVARLTLEMDRLFPETKTDEYFRLPLTQNMFAVIDAIDRERVSALGKWWAQISNSGVHATMEIAGKKIYLHNLITGNLNTGFRNKLPLDCRRQNLFCEGRRGVMQNRRGKSNTSSKFKNVHLKTGEDKWRVSLKTPNEGAINFGRYSSEEEAARVADAAALKLFGPHAFLNFPDETVTEYSGLIERFLIRRRLRLARKRIAKEISETHPNEAFRRVLKITEGIE